MKTFYFFAWLISFLTIVCAAESVNSDYLKGDKVLAILGEAADLPSKAEDSNPIFSSKVDIKLDRLRDCSEILASGRKESGVYLIWLEKSETAEKPLQVYCDMETDHEGWLVIQRRGKYQVQQDFNQDWETYKNGFGEITQEFWLGNENIRVLCERGCKIRFDIQGEDGSKGFAIYEHFELKSSNYNLDISNYYGNIGDSMQPHNNNAFSTCDHGNTAIAIQRQGGWWYSYETYSNLNGIYQPDSRSGRSVYWFTFLGPQNLRHVEIKVRRK